MHDNFTAFRNQSADRLEEIVPVRQRRNPLGSEPILVERIKALSLIEEGDRDVTVIKRLRVGRKRLPRHAARLGLHTVVGAPPSPSAESGGLASRNRTDALVFGRSAVARVVLRCVRRHLILKVGPTHLYCI